VKQEVKLHFGPYGVAEPKRVQKKTWNKLRNGLDHSKQMWGSVEILVLVALKIGLAELVQDVTRHTPCRIE
jgi:hypothetical protein